MSKQVKTSAPLLPPISVDSNSHVAPPPPDPQGDHPNPPAPPPAPAPAPAPPPPPPPAPAPSPTPNHPKPDGSHKTARHRFLSPTEWAIVAQGIGGIQDREHNKPVHPTSWWWPPKGMPRGLYKETVTQRVKFFYLYHLSSTVRWLLMILQLLIGAALTALGSMSFKDGTPITVLGAANTVIAGLLAFLQNSGLPDRYRYDKAEFETLEDHIRELLDSGIAPADQATDQILAECFELFQDAKTTVSSNLPANYTSRLAQQAAQRNSGMTPAGSQPTTSKAPGAPQGDAGAANALDGK